VQNSSAVSPPSYRPANSRSWQTSSSSLSPPFPDATILGVDNADESKFIAIGLRDDWQGFDSDNVDERDLFNDDGVSLGIHRVAFTRTDDDLAVSVDGGVFTTSLTGGGPPNLTLPEPGSPMVNTYLGGFAGSTGKAINIRRFAIYDAKINSLLPVLSAP
jgi:hypothetical protein